jgi:hypothetical protein
MANLNFSQKSDPVSPPAYNTPLFNLGINISGSETCKPKHCGVCGECRQKMWAAVGEIGGDLYGDDYLDYQGAGWYGVNPPPEAVAGPPYPDDTDETDYSYTAFFQGPAIWKTYAEYEAACPDDGCTSPNGAASLSPDAVYIPLSFIKNQTECLAHAATLPSGEEAAWFTTANPYDGYFGSNASYKTS